MDNMIKGLAYVLGDDVDTDQIIPAKHLIYDIKDPKEKKMYAQYALSGLKDGTFGLPQGNIPFVKDGVFFSDFQILVAGRNFGCGSSREHAPFALREAGIKLLIAESYSRIFFRNSVDGAFYPPIESQGSLVKKIQTGDRLTVDLSENTLKNETQGHQHPLNPLGDVREILEAGGIFEYAKRHNQIKSL